MIKLFTDKSYLTPKNRSVVFPLLFDLWYLPSARLAEKYQLVDSLTACDIVVVPVDLAHFGGEHKIKEFISTALNAKKVVWIYSAGDYGQSIDYPVYIFRNGGFDSKLNQKTMLLPSFINDPLVFLKEDFIALAKPIQPKIGFVGHANNSMLKLIKERWSHFKYCVDLSRKVLITDAQPFYPSSRKRFRLLQQLQKDNRITTNFIFRKRYHSGFKNTKDKINVTLSFFQNIQTNPYTFCVRGAGNFSVRFYETLAMGRIPFVIDTDFRLPLDQIIDWDAHCVMASEDQAIAALLDFHHSISPEHFIQMQIDNRKLWLEFLEREAYFIKIHSIFKQMIDEV